MADSPQGIYGTHDGGADYDFVIKSLSAILDSGVVSKLK